MRGPQPTGCSFIEQSRLGRSSGGVFHQPPRLGGRADGRQERRQGAIPPGGKEGRASPYCASPASGQARQIVKRSCQAHWFRAPHVPTRPMFDMPKVSRDSQNCKSVFAKGHPKPSQSHSKCPGQSQRASGPVHNLRRAERNRENYRLSASGYLAELDRMTLEVRDYLWSHPAEAQPGVPA